MAQKHGDAESGVGSSELSGEKSISGDNEQQRQQQLRPGTRRSPNRNNSIIGSILHLNSGRTLKNFSIGPSRSEFAKDSLSSSCRKMIQEERLERQRVKLLMQQQRQDKMKDTASFFEPVPAQYPMIEFSIDVELKRTAVMFVEVEFMHYQMRSTFAVAATLLCDLMLLMSYTLS